MQEKQLCLGQNRELCDILLVLDPSSLSSLSAAHVPGAAWQPPEGVYGYGALSKLRSKELPSSDCMTVPRETPLARLSVFEQIQKTLFPGSAENNYRQVF